MTALTFALAVVLDYRLAFPDYAMLGPPSAPPHAAAPLDPSAAPAAAADCPDGRCAYPSRSVAPRRGIFRRR
ncbi:hypothetical protein [Thermopirellula anaerolimosa]